MKKHIIFIGMLLIFSGTIFSAKDSSSQHLIQIKQNSTAENFIRSIYASYENGASLNIFAAQTRPLLSPTLLILFDEEGTLPLEGPGVLDGDPFCDCQNYEKLKIHSIVIKKIDPAKKIVTVSFSIFDNEPNKVVEYHLLKINGLWCIDDIYTPTDHFSLRAELEKEIKQYTKNT